MTTTLKMQDMVKVGDILVDRWGYTMTIVDFYRVMKVSGKSVLVRRLSSVETADGYLSGTSVPGVMFARDNDQSYRAFMRTNALGELRFASSLNNYGTVHYLRLWDGQPKGFNHCD